MQSQHEPVSNRSAPNNTDELVPRLKLVGFAMAVYPAQLTTEEKNLKRRYARLQEKVRR